MNQKYAVVHWYNYRKELHAGFMRSFNNFENARSFAYRQAENDIINYNSNEENLVITEDEITDINGPGKYGSPYANKTIIGYGGRNSNGYATTFYCVVEWFRGVENDWNDCEDKDWDELYDGEWYPSYSY